MRKNVFFFNNSMDIKTIKCHQYYFSFGPAMAIATNCKQCSASIGMF